MFQKWLDRKYLEQGFLTMNAKLCINSRPLQNVKDKGLLLLIMETSFLTNIFSN